MKVLILAIPTSLVLLLGCAGTYPAPTQQMADVEAANRTANELGAQNNPKAQLHLKLAEEQLKLAKSAVKDDDNERAEGLLTRAKADAELAVAMTRADDAKAQATKAIDESNAQRTTNTDQGARP